MSVKQKILMAASRVADKRARLSFDFVFITFCEFGKQADYQCDSRG
jgi:hypothetical protein